MALRITPLGGVGHFGRNCTLLELEDGPALLVDCGARFVADEAPGFDLGLPDLERIAALGDRLLAYVITHGHEDHIGGLPYALRENDKPIYATPFTARLIERRFERNGLDVPAINIVDVGATRELSPFSVEWVAVSHSIPDSSALVVTTPVGRVVLSGDFRVDDDPVLGPRTDLDALARAGDAGVLCLLADSTGAPLPGRNAGERSVAAPLRALVESAPGRTVVALFASHVQRLALLGDACRAARKRLALLGRGLLDVYAAARDARLLDLSDILVDVGDLESFPRERQVIAATGSQGERGSGLFRLAMDDASAPRLDAGDRVVVAARVIPGNERRVYALLERFAERGLEVIEGARAPHVSGHGQAGDMELLLSAVRPRSFVAIHGNARNLRAHAALVKAGGLSPERIVDLRDGSTLVLHDAGALEHLPGVPALEPLVAFGEVVMFAKDVLHARRRMGQAGVLVVTPAGLFERGVSPPLSDELRALVREAAPSALAAAGTGDEPAALKQLARLFWRARRLPPEILLLK